MAEKRLRQQRIRELLARNQVRSQEQLQALLRAESVEVTQATLSRDLRELGAAKHGDGYVLPGPEMPARSERKQLERALREALVSAERAGTLVVLRTQAGLDHSLCLRIEAARLPQVLGTIAGNDTLFVAAASWNQAEELLRLFRRLARL